MVVVILQMIFTGVLRRTIAIARGFSISTIVISTTTTRASQTIACVQFGFFNYLVIYQFNLIEKSSSMLCIGIIVEIGIPMKNGKSWLTRKDALDKFKEAKELFDLGLIIKDELIKNSGS
jgi:hypothetical protein